MISSLPARPLAMTVSVSLVEVSPSTEIMLKVYGSNKSFEWGFTDGSLPYVTTLHPLSGNLRGRPTTFEQVEMPNFHTLLPESIQQFTVGGNFDPLNPQASLKKGKGGGHHGSHPHLVHEFLSSIVEGRKPWIDEVMGANITAAGLCAHQSAMEDGKEIIVPTFD